MQTLCCACERCSDLVGISLPPIDKLWLAGLSTIRSIQFLLRYLQYRFDRFDFWARVPARSRPIWAHLGPLGPFGPIWPIWAHWAHWAHWAQWALGPIGPFGHIGPIGSIGAHWALWAHWALGPIGPFGAIWAHWGPGQKNIYENKCYWCQATVWPLARTI